MRNPIDIIIYLAVNGNLSGSEYEAVMRLVEKEIPALRWEVSAKEAELKKAKTAFENIVSFPHYSYGDNEAACSMAKIANDWLDEKRTQEDSRF